MKNNEKSTSSNNPSLVYMVAGISSRFQGKIKQFAKVGPQGETLIEYSLKQALPAGFARIIFIIGSKTEKPFKEFFRNNYKGIPVQYAFQGYNPKLRDKPWGTADALCTIMDIIDNPFIVCNGDDLYGEESFKILTNHLRDSDENSTIGYKLIEVLPEHGEVHRGIFKVHKDYVTGLEETFDLNKSNLESKLLRPDELCSMNIFALFPETVYKLYTLLQSFKKENKKSRTAECLLPTEISNLIKTNQIKMKIYPTPSKWYGVTNPRDEITVSEALKKSERGA